MDSEEESDTEEEKDEDEDGRGKGPGVAPKEHMLTGPGFCYAFPLLRLGKPPPRGREAAGRGLP